MKEFNKQERSLLLFLETQSVEHGGVILDPRHLNKEDIELATSWDFSEFIEFARYSYDALNNRKVLTYKVRLSDSAIDHAHKLRKEKIRRSERKEILEQ